MHDPVALHALAQAFELRPHAPNTLYDADASFRTLELGLAHPVGEVGPASWLAGHIEGQEVLVVPHAHDSGLGWADWTAFIAAIDPPLFLGAVLREERMWEQGDAPLGVPGFDADVHATTRNIGDIEWFLQAWRPESRPLMEHIRTAVTHSMRITDSTVTYAVAGVPSPQRADWPLRHAARVARMLGERRRERLRFTEADAHVKAWRAFAERFRLSFDRHAWRLRGERDGFPVVVSIEPTPTVFRTLTAFMVSGMNEVGVRVRKRSLPAPWGTTEAPIVPLGDDAFDRELVVRGEPSRVAQAFASAPLRSNLAALAAEAVDVRIDGDRFAFTLAGTTPSFAELETRILGRGLAIATALPRAQAAPYR